MVDLGVALTWIAMSAVSAKGLSVFARAAATSEIEMDQSLTNDPALAHDDLSLVDAPSRLLHGPP